MYDTCIPLQHKESFFATTCAVSIRTYLFLSYHVMMYHPHHTSHFSISVLSWSLFFLLTNHHVAAIIPTAPTSKPILVA